MSLQVLGFLVAVALVERRVELLVVVANGSFSTGFPNAFPLTLAQCSLFRRLGDRRG